MCCFNVFHYVFVSYNMNENNQDFDMDINDAIDLNKLAQLISSTDLKHENTTSSILKQPKKVSIKSPTSSDTNELTKINTSINKGNGSSTKKNITEEKSLNTNSSAVSDKFEMMGFSLPTQTLYLIIVLIVIAVALWYYTGEKTKKSKSKEDEE